ncbi:hypothetical protein D0T50_06620 [Bacteroides sp. 214]|uniref:hypothetical protein n=1 Tax=Bacteroides sp. 214 TaxID=2302935 RepID=UPI0013D24990|nr:hypothetical protein [Bacteroides sp. 214]NDW12563.1 hypothetical protein [Bacteroides sp. 214]
MKLITLLAVTLLSSTLLLGCRTQKTQQTETETKTEIIVESSQPTRLEAQRTGGGNRTASRAMPAVIVYKTTKDYNNLVPVIMNDARTAIVSYPHPTDAKRGSGYATPTRLKNGYLLDNRGINRNVAFLNYTYEAYSKLTAAPSIEELLNCIVDKYPLVEMYECSRKTDYSNVESELNAVIEKGFPNCKRVVGE